MKEEITFCISKKNWESVVSDIRTNAVIRNQQENISLNLEPCAAGEWGNQTTKKFMDALAIALSTNWTLTSLTLGRFLKKPKEEELPAFQKAFKIVFETNKTLTALKLLGSGYTMVIINALQEALASPHSNVVIRGIGLGGKADDNKSLNVPVISATLNALPALTALTLNNLDSLLEGGNALTEKALASLQLLALPQSALTPPMLISLKQKLSLNLANLRVMEVGFSKASAIIPLSNILSAQTNLEVIHLKEYRQKKSVPKDFARLLAAIQGLNHIKEITFDNCRFDNLMIAILHSSLQGKTALKELILSNSHTSASGNPINFAAILNSIALNRWPQLKHLALPPFGPADDETFSSLKTLLKQDVITTLFFNPKSTFFKNTATIAALLQIIASNKSSNLRILQLPQQQTPPTVDDEFYYSELCGYLEKKCRLDELGVSLPTTEAFPEFSRVIKAQASIATLCLDPTSSSIFNDPNKNEKQTSLLEAIQQNRSLENVSIMWESSAMLTWYGEGNGTLPRYHRDSRGGAAVCVKEPFRDVLNQHLKQNGQNRQNRLANIVFFIGMLSQLSTGQDSNNSLLNWKLLPHDIRSLIWQFWQLTYPMGKTSQQIDACVRFFNSPDTASAVKKLVTAKQQRPLLLIEHCVVKDGQPTPQFELCAKEARTPELQISL